MTTAQRSLFDDYFDALVRCDAATATDLVMDLLESGASLHEIVDDVLAPAQTRVGELWERGEWSVAQEHAATAVTEAAVSALWVMTTRRQLTDGPRVAMACADGEWHALPARMAAAVAAEAGAHVTVLGPSMPPDHLQRWLVAGDVDALAVSCTVPANLIGAARCVTAAHAVGLPVVVGGRAFDGRQQRADAVGADLLADAPHRLSEPPPAAGEDAVLDDEAVRLDAAVDRSVADLLSLFLSTSPSLAGLPPADLDRTRDDVRWLVRATAATVLTGDPDLLDDTVAAFLRMPRNASSDVVVAGVELVAGGLEPLAPRGATLLRQAVRRAEPPG